MSEEETMSVEETQEAVAQAPESEEMQTERQASEPDRRKRNDAEYNWAEARRKMQELEKRNQELQEAVSKIQTQNQPPEKDEFANLADEDFLTVAQARKLAQKMARDVAEGVVKQREAATVDERLQLKYSDYAEIVSKENIELLKQTEPELALSLAHTPDPYQQGVAAYKLLKKIVKQEAPMTQEKKKAIENSQKPLSANAASKSAALGNAHMFENGLTPELKKQLQKEMQEAIKRY